jgi:hypothetical protein
MGGGVQEVSDMSVLRDKTVHSLLRKPTLQSSDQAFGER